jgi:hypothetical protein
MQGVGMDKLKLFSDEIMPRMSKICEAGCPEIFRDYCGNLCQQASMLAALYLVKECGVGDAEVKMYFSKFRGFNNSMSQRQMEWEHAWIAFTIDGKRYTLDQNGWQGVRINLSQSDRVDRLSFHDHAYMSNVRELHRLDMDIWSMMNEDEFFTGRKLPDIYKEIMKEVAA